MHADDLGPGAEVLADPSRQAELEGYVSGVIGRFRDDARVLAWDLFNEADSPNPAYRDAELADKAERATELLAKVYPWSRAAGPSQPITAGIYGAEWGELDRASDIRRLMLAQSDVISFHSYQPADALRERGSVLLPLLERWLIRLHPEHPQAAPCAFSCCRHCRASSRASG